MGKRRRARETVLQALYEAEFSERVQTAIIDEQIGRRAPSDETAEYARALFLKTIEKKDELDRIIDSLLENWDPARVSLVDRNILRFALTEVLYFPDVPASVIVDEAIEVAHRFSSEEAGRFVNGLVDRFVKEFRKDGA
ncbi:MAG TPA: transcription antitermination factor NusB [Candidatus Krumholzibacteria bacterium]|nr:transcription antitermination factor NusB [Candidatus Krumholzibacteria bacterium]